MNAIRCSCCSAGTAANTLQFWVVCQGGCNPGPAWVPGFCLIPPTLSLTLLLHPLPNACDSVTRSVLSRKFPGSLRRLPSPTKGVNAHSARMVAVAYRHSSTLSTHGTIPPPSPRHTHTRRGNRTPLAPPGQPLRYPPRTCSVLTRTGLIMMLFHKCTCARTHPHTFYV